MPNIDKEFSSDEEYKMVKIEVKQKDKKIS